MAYITTFWFCFSCLKNIMTILIAHVFYLLLEQFRDYDDAAAHGSYPAKKLMFSDYTIPAIPYHLPQ